VTDLWVMAGEEAERDAAEHKLALARVACANYWPVLASAETKDSYEHAKALISEGVTTAVAGVAVSPADQAILASLVLDSFDEDWDAHQASIQAALIAQGAFSRQHYEAIAQTLHEYQAKNAGGGMIPGLAEHWSDRLAPTSALFNKERFLHAATQGSQKGSSLDMPMMTQDHYEALADAIASSPTRHRQGLAQHFAEALKGSNVKFKPDLFMRRANPTQQERGRGQGEGTMSSPGTGRERARSHVDAARTAVVTDAPGYADQHPFGLPAIQDPETDEQYQGEVDAWEGANREQRVNMGNGLGVSDDSSGPNVEGPGQNQGEDPLLHASALDIEAGLEPGNYRIDAFGALVLVERAQPVAVRHTAPGGGEHAPYYVRREGDKYRVVNRNGDVKGTFNTKEEARGQQKALYANVPGAQEEAEKRHGETPKAVSEEGKKATRHTARELRCTKCKQEMTGGSKGDKDSNSGGRKIDWGSCPEGGSHTPEWGPDKEASLQMTALQRQAVAASRRLVDQMPLAAEVHAIAKAMYMRAKGFDLTDDETDLIVNAAISRANERRTGGRLDFTKQAAFDGLAGDIHRMNHGDRSRYESEGHAFEVSYHERPAYGDMGDPVPKSDKYSGTTGEYTLYHPHGQAQEFHVGPSVHAKGYQAEKVRDTMMDTWSKKKMNRLMSQGNLHTADGVSEEKRDRAESAGDTLPGTDKFPITNKTDLENAKHDIGRTTEPHDKVVNYINRKADELGAPGVGEEKKESALKRLWARVTRTGQGGGMANPMDPSSTANPFSPAQDVGSTTQDTNPDMGAAAGGGGMMDPSSQPPDEVPGQTIPGSATGTAASSKPRTKPSDNPNAPNKPAPPQPYGMGMQAPGQMMTTMPMMAAHAMVTKAQVTIAEAILDNNPGMSDDDALRLASKTIDRYPHLVREAYGGFDFPFGDEDVPGSTCSQCGKDAFDSRTGHCHNCGFINGTGGAGYDPLAGPTTIAPGRADLRNPGIR
jgi:hypothetical protein